MLDAGTVRRSPRGSQSARSGWGRSSRCCAIRRSTSCSSAARRRCGSSAAGGSRRPTCGSAARPSCATSIERILAPLGRRADEAEPLCDARLPDGSRVNVVLPPLALDGPLLTIRRFRPRGFAPADLVAHGTVTPPLLDFLGRAVAARCTLLICGGTGSGKTTTLGALAAFVDPAERVVTIEDAAELRLGLPHVVRLESRPPNLEGRGEVTIRRLVRNALRMRPDRLIVGEVRGPEALDLLVALSTGHAGSLCTIHAGSAAEALRRLETLALMADIGLPLAAIRDQIADAIDLVVRQERGAGRHAPDRRGRRGRARGRRPGGAASCSRCAPAGRPGARRWTTRWRAGSPVRRHSGPAARRRRPPAWLAAGAAGAGVVGTWEALAAVERTRVAAAAARVLEPLARVGPRGPRADGARAAPALGGRGRRAARGRLAGRRRSRSACSRRSPDRRRSSSPSGRAGAPLARGAAPRGARVRAHDGRRAGRGPLDPRRDRRRRRERRRRGGARAADGGARARAGRADRRRAARLQRRAPDRTRGTRSPPRCCSSATPAATSPALLRELAASGEAADRAERDARAATAQARFTAWLVLGLPLAGGGGRGARRAGLRRVAARQPAVGLARGARARCSSSPRSLCIGRLARAAA